MHKPKIEKTPEGVILRLPGRRLRLLISHEDTVYVDGELGRLETTELSCPNLGPNYESVAWMLASLLTRAAAEPVEKPKEVRTLQQQDPAKYRDILRALATGDSIRSIARKFKVSPHTVSQILAKEGGPA